MTELRILPARPRTNCRVIADFYSQRGTAKGAQSQTTSPGSPNPVKT